MTLSARAEDARDSQALEAALRELGLRYDAAPCFPSESLALLAGHGLHRRFAPVEAGGERFADPFARYQSIDRALRFVGRCDLSVGRLYEGHVNALLLFDWHATRDQRNWLAGQLDRGAWFGVWATEPPPGVRLAHTPDGDRLTGAKVFASGAGGIDFALVTAASDDTDRRLVIVPAGEAARTDQSGWRVRGMRASLSGRYDLSGLEIGDVDLLGPPGAYDRDPAFTAGAWRFCAVQLGGIEALVDETRRSMRAETRADPVARARFADAAVAARTASYWVEEARRLAAADDPAAIAQVRLTRGVVERAGLDVIEAATRLLGTRSAFDGEVADKIIRDLSLYLRQGGPDHARDEAAKALLADKAPMRAPW